MTAWIAACQASVSINNSQNLLKLMPIELVMPSSTRSDILLSSHHPWASSPTAARTEAKDVQCPATIEGAPGGTVVLLKVRDFEENKPGIHISSASCIGWRVLYH